jgi:Polyketide cyclase / dehydrase and lipid transport
MTRALPSAGIDIDAPLAAVWAVLLDVGRYPEWNPFIRRVESPATPRVGDPIRLHVVFRGGTRVVSPERVTTLVPPYVDPAGVTRAELAYVYEGMPARLGLVRGTRWQRLAQQHGATRYETVEVFRGPLVRWAGPGRVEDGFRRQAQALRQRAEGGR